MSRPTDGVLSARLLLIAVLVGAVAGAAGIALTLLLHLVQHLAFGYTEATFLTGVERASPTRRVLAMTLGGLIVGLGWWVLGRRRTEIVAVETALAEPSRTLSIPRLTTDAALQVIGVGFGASLGREGAPRQVGAALAGWLAVRFRLTSSQRRTMLACGAGAGLAAVYNVPLAGALFTLEILLVSVAPRDVVPAVITSAVAAVIAWPVLTAEPIYPIPPLMFHPSLLVWAVLIGPPAAVVGAAFDRLMVRARALAPRSWRLPVVTTAVFAAVGALAIPFPQLLGNGKGPTQLALDGTLTVLAVLALTLLKPLATAACLAAGARGGLLTPALATGALLGALTGAGWAQLWPGAAPAAFALIGAAAVLAVTQRAPLCALALVLEFTHTGLELLVPLMIAVGGAMFTASVISPGSKEPAAADPIDGADPSRGTGAGVDPTSGADPPSGPGGAGDPTVGADPPSGPGGSDVDARIASTTDRPEPVPRKAV